MLFKPKYVEKIKKGTKTATRRDWEKKMAKKDGVYPVQTEMFQPKTECEVFIKATDVYKNRLGNLTLSDARKEGGYSVEEFKEVWKEINGSWEPYKKVWVVEFEKISKDEVVFG